MSRCLKFSGSPWKNANVRAVQTSSRSSSHTAQKIAKASDEERDAQIRALDMQSQACLQNRREGVSHDDSQFTSRGVFQLVSAHFCDHAPRFLLRGVGIGKFRPVCIDRVRVPLPDVEIISGHVLHL